MSIDRDDCDERQVRVDRMVDEYRKAQSRPLVKATDKAVESQVEADTKAAVTGSTTSTMGASRP